MNQLAFLALIRREVLRGRKQLLILSVVTGAALFLALLGGDAATGFALILAIPGSMLTILGPSGDLGSDKLLGHLESDRVLPFSTRLTAMGRLAGASIRLVPVAIGALAATVMAAREIDGGSLGVLLIVAIPAGAFVLASMASWTLLALNARWQFRNLWWLPVTIVIGPQIASSMLPADVKSAITQWLESAGRGVAAFALTPVGAMTSLLAAVLLPFAVFVGATLLFASGLERYRYDANVLGAMLGKAPTRELGAIGRGPLLAVARLRIRLALEQQRRQSLFFLVLVAVLLVGPDPLKEFAEIYLRVLAVLLPAGIAMQLSAARGMGHLEGLQQLPHPGRTVALGHLAAIAVMSAPGAAVLLLSRFVAGRSPGLMEGFRVWGWFVTGAWITAVLAVWLRARYLAMTAGGATAALLLWYAIAGGPGMVQDLRGLAVGFQNLRASAGVALPIAVAMLVAAVGVPLFARGVETYQFRGK